MSNITVIPGGHEVKMFTKTAKTRTGLDTYSDTVKREIVVQLCNILRDPLYNKTKAIKALAEIHDIVPSTITKWIPLYGSDLSTPLPISRSRLKTEQVKAESVVKSAKKITHPVSDEFSFDKLVSGVSLIDNSSILDKVLKIIKSIPAVDITVSIRPNNK